jgi:hypothetical protein
LSTTLTKLKDERDRIVKRKNLYLKKQKPASAILALGLVMVLGFVVVSPALVASRSSSILIGYAIASLSVLFLSLLLYRRASGFDMRTEEWFFLRAHKILVSLTDYLQDKDHLAQFRKDAEKALSVLVSRIEEKWATGGFKLAEGVLSPLAKLKRGLRETLLIAIQKGEKIDLCRDVMVELCNYLLSDSPGILSVNRINAVLSRIGPVEGTKARHILVLDWLKHHLRIRSVAPPTVTLASGLVLFSILTSNGFTKEAALGPSVEMSIGFTSIYVAWLGIQKYVKRKS